MFVPPAIVSVSVRRATVPVPASAAVLSVVARATVPAESKWPLSLTVNTGIAVCEPYVPAVTEEAR